LNWGGKVISQIPQAREFQPGENWPKELVDLYTEASACYAAGAPTATAMLSRKVLMACACDKGAKEGESFVSYVDYIVSKVLNYDKAKTAIEAIKNIGNEANHKVQFVTPQDAHRSMSIIRYMLNTIYSLPVA
jgi:hypothetical protein